MTVFRSRPDIEPIPVLGPYMDAGRNPNALQRGTFAEVVGADGRFIGGIKPFPGFALTKRLSTVVSSLASVNLLRYFAVQKGTTTNQLRGFLVRGSVDGGSTYNVYLIYYDTGTAAWASYTAFSGVTATVSIGITSVGKFIYAAVAGSAPSVIWHDGTNWVKKTMGPQVVAPGAPTAGTETTGGVLPAGSYGVAYRFYDSNRATYSGMSGTTVVDTAAESGGAIQFDIPYPTGTTVTDFDTIYIYRTISVASAESNFDGGVLYWETSVSVPSGWTTGTFHDKTSTYLTAGTVFADEILVQQTSYDPWEDKAGVPPTSGTIDYYQSTIFMGRPSTAAGGLGGFQWSGVTTFTPENFNPDHLCRGTPGEGEVIKMVQAGDVEYALTPNLIYRIRKLGTQLSVSRLHTGRGLASSNAAHGVGDDLLLLTPLGLAVVNGRDGSMAVHTEMDRVIYGRWATSLTTVFSAYDAAMGMSIWVNTTLGEAIVLWHTTKLATLLRGVFTVSGDSGPDPVLGGVPRFFATTVDGLVVSPDLSATPTGTMEGVNGTGAIMNGTVSTASASAIIDGGLGLWAGSIGTLVGSYVYQVSGTYAGRWGRITSTASHTLNVTWVGTSGTTSVGDRYAISPVVFSLTCKPLESTTQEIPDAERVVCKSLTVMSQGLAVRFGTDNAYWALNAVVDGVVGTENSAAVALATKISGQPSSTAPGAVAGFKVQPVVSCYSTGAQFEIIGLEASKTLGSGRST
jgi:hypothetical protein